MLTEDDQWQGVVIMFQVFFFIIIFYLFLPQPRGGKPSHGGQVLVQVFCDDLSISQ